MLFGPLAVLSRIWTADGRRTHRWDHFAIRVRVLRRTDSAYKCDHGRDL